VTAEQQAREKLWDSFLAQARAQRLSGRPGQRFDGLAAISAAAAIHKSVELRNEAIACLALTDIRLLTNTPATASSAERIFVDWPHEQYVCSSANGAISLRRLSDRAELLRLPPVGPIDFLQCISPDGRWLGIAGTGGKVHIVDLKQSVSTVSLNDASFVAFSPDSREAVIDVGTNSFTIVKLDGTGAHQAFALPGDVSQLAWSPDGRLIAAAGGTMIYLIDSKSRTVAQQFPVASDSMQIAWHPDGIHLALAGGDRLIRILNVTDGTQLPPLAGHLGSVTCLCFHPDGDMLASAGWDGQLRLWDWRHGREIIKAAAGPEALAFSPDGHYLANYWRFESQLNVFELVRNEIVLTLNQTPRPNGGDAVLFGPDSHWLVTGVDDSTSFWDPRDGHLMARLNHLPLGFLQRLPQDEGFLGWSDDFYLIEPKFRDGTLQVSPPSLFRPAIPEALQKWFPGGFPGPTLRRFEVRLGGSVSGRTAVAACAGHGIIFDATANRIRAVTGAQAAMKYVAVSPDDRCVATAGWNSPNVKIWDAATGEEVTTLPCAHSANLAFSPDGRWLVTGSGTDYCFWRVSDWSPVRRIARPGLDDFPGPMAFSADGKLLAIAYSRAIVRLVEPETGNLLAQLEPTPGNDLIALAFNSDASELAVTQVDAPPQIWHLRHIREQLAAMSLAW
jgi:WD40 repeat protein